MMYVIREAIYDYRNKEVWQKLMYNAAICDFSWKKSAGEYEALYMEMLK